MAQHRSLRAASTLGGKRNVMKRFERIEILKKRGQWKEDDRVTADGKAIRPKRKLYLALNKPRNYVCSRDDERGRRTIYELIPKEWTSVYSVGRLDYASEGLIFLTNDGEFSLHLTHPRYGVRKKYVAIVEGKLERAILQNFVHGIFHEGEKLKAEKAHLVSATNSQSVVELELAEGKNRE